MKIGATLSLFFLLIASLAQAELGPTESYNRLICIKRSIERVVELRQKELGPSVEKADRELILQNKKIKDFKEEYQNFFSSQFTQEKVVDLNDRFIKKVANEIDQSEKVQRQFYVVSENAILKELNDTILTDKSLVTSLDNFTKITIRELLNSDKFPLLKSHFLSGTLDIYHDFKSLKLRFDGNQSKELETEINHIFDLTSVALQKKVDELGLKPLSLESRGLGKTPENWYLIGTGNTHDQASASARVARSRFRSTPPKKSEEIKQASRWIGPVPFHDAKTVFQRTFGEIKKSFVAFSDSYHLPGRDRLFELEDGFPAIPNIDLVAILRKNKGTNYENKIENLRKDIREFFKVDITKNEALALESFYQDIDRFSPSLLIKERVTLDYAKKAKAHVLSFDVQKQGAYNNYEIMKEFAKIGNKNFLKSIPEESATIYQSEKIENILKVARIAEKKATEGMMKVENDLIEVLDSFFKDVGFVTSKDEIRKMISRTGDDINVFLPEEFLQKPPGGKFSDEYFKNLSHKISLSSSGNRLRNVNVPHTYKNGVVLPREFISNFITRGELAHKQLQESIVRKYLNLEELRNLHITVNVKPELGETGSLDIFIKGVSDKETLRKINVELQNFLHSSEKMKGINTISLSPL